MYARSTEDTRPPSARPMARSRRVRTRPVGFAAVRRLADLPLRFAGRPPIHAGGDSKLRHAGSFPVALTVARSHPKVQVNGSADGARLPDDGVRNRR